MSDPNDPIQPPQAEVSPAELLGRALESRPVTGDPQAWEPPSPQDLQAQLPGYEVQQFLARGGMGAVYRGVQVSLGRIVAIKILPPYLSQSDPQYAERFKQEARAMAQLNHPGIVSVYDFGQMTDGTLFFVMEYIDGTDVAQMVMKQGRVHSNHAMAIVAHVCDALQYAHEHGVVHRDIKPANIMVGYDGRVKVADFGLAKSLTRRQQLSLTQSGFVMGTPHFLAPEAMMPGSTLDHRADIYAVGVMLYQMLTGKLPQGVFEMPSLQVPGLDPRYDQIIVNAMREDREQRFPSVLHLRRALDAILTQPVERSEVAKQTVPTSVVAPEKPVSRSVAQSSQSIPQKAAPKPQPGQHYYRPPQVSAPPPAKKAFPILWVTAAALAIAAGGYGWMQRKTAGEHPPTPVIASPAEPKYAPSVVQDSGRPAASRVTPTPAPVISSTPAVPKSTLVQPARRGPGPKSPDALNLTQPLQLGPVGALTIRYTAFNNATIAEAAEYLRIKSRELDPKKEGLQILLDETITDDLHKITMDLHQLPVSEILRHVALMARLDVIPVGSALKLTASPDVRPPYPTSPASARLTRVLRTILPTMVFQKANLAEAVEYIRVKGRDMDPQKELPHLLIDPALDVTTGRITLDVKNVPLTEAIRYVAELADAQPICLGEVIYLQPKQNLAAKKTTASEVRALLLNYKWLWTGRRIQNEEVTFHEDGSATVIDWSFKWRIDPTSLNMMILTSDSDKEMAFQFNGDFTQLDGQNGDVHVVLTKGRHAPALAKLPAMPPTQSPKPTATSLPEPANPANTAQPPAISSTDMKLKEPWMPHNIHTRKEWLAALDFYSKEVIRKGISKPRTIWGSFTWLMPLAQATSLLPRGSYKLKTVSAAKLAYPEGISVEFWHVGGKGYEDDLEVFDEIAFVLDDARRIVSLQLGENSYKTLNWKWQNKTGPDGDRNPYYDFLNDSANGKNGRKVFYQFRPGPPGVTNVKLVLDGSTSSHWYLTEPLAEKFTQIYAEVNKQGL